MSTVNVGDEAIVLEHVRVGDDWDARERLHGWVAEIDAEHVRLAAAPDWAEDEDAWFSVPYPLTGRGAFTVIPARRSQGLQPA